MSNEELNSLDDYERFLSTIIEMWSVEQRIALATAMAERWLPAYEAFSAREEWGDPASLRRSLQVVWDHVLGHVLAPKDRRRQSAQVAENTPHLDDFEAPEAIAACAMIGCALSCCETPDNLADAVMAMVSCFEAIAPGIYTSPEEIPAGLWQLIEIQNEVAKQVKVLEQIRDITHFDEPTIEALRQAFTAPDLVGKVSPRATPTTPPGLTNEALFEPYRRMLEVDLKGKSQWNDDLENLGANTGATLITRVAEWLARYSRRKQTIDGTYGPMADVRAQRALMTRHQLQDVAEKEVPDWDDDTRFWIDLCYKNPGNGLDVNSPEAPHAYGPSLRRLWVEAKRRGESEKEIWKSIIHWGRHRPAAWEAEDQRKKKGLAHATPELSARLALELSWSPTDDVDYPWAIEVDGERWQVRLNDFPDDLMYSLVINGDIISDFHDWPESWRRDD